MRGDRTNYGKGNQMQRYTVRLTKEEIAYVKSCKCFKYWTVPFTIRQIILEHKEKSK